MIQLIQVEQARMKGTSLLPTVSLRLTAVSVMTRVAVGLADVWKLETFALIVYRCSTATAWITNISGIHLSRAIQQIYQRSPKYTGKFNNTTCQSNYSVSCWSCLYLSDNPVSDCKPVSNCCRCNDKSSCWICRCVKVGNTSTNCLLLQCGHCMNNKCVGIYLSWAVRPPLTMKLSTFP